MGLFGNGGLKSGFNVAALLLQDIVARSISLTQASGSIAVQLVTGARLKLGGGTSDYLESNGTNTITAAGALKAQSNIQFGVSSAVSCLCQGGGGGGFALLQAIGNGGIWLGGNATDGAGAIANRIDSIVNLTTTGARLLSVTNNSGASEMFAIGFEGRIILPSTDSSGTPGAATINQATGRSAIALGAASCVVTNSLVSAASHVFISPRTRDATGVLPLVTTIGAGSFTVTVTANCTADLVFDWLVIT